MGPCPLKPCWFLAGVWERECLEGQDPKLVLYVSCASSDPQPSSPLGSIYNSNSPSGWEPTGCLGWDGGGSRALRTQSHGKYCLEAMLGLCDLPTGLTVGHWLNAPPAEAGSASLVRKHSCPTLWRSLTNHKISCPISTSIPTPLPLRPPDSTHVEGHRIFQEQRR